MSRSVNRVSRVGVMLALLAALLVWSGNAMAAHDTITVHCVPNTGVAASCGDAHASIQTAIDDADAGETVRVGAGTYNEDIAINKALILEGLGNPKIRGVDGGSLATVDLRGAATISGFTITQPDAVPVDGRANSIAVALNSAATGATLGGNTVEGHITGIYVAAPTSGATVSGNKITGNGNGILIEGGVTGVSISGNEITMNNVPPVSQNRGGIRLLAGFTPTGNSAHGNQIVGNGAQGVNNQGTGTESFNAQSNWWGCVSGPGNSGCDSTTGNVDFTLFCTTASCAAGAVGIDCNVEDDDIAAVQAAVNSNATTVGLAGVCDFSAAPFHGGDAYGIDNAAVVINRDNLTINSAAAPQSGTVLGSGIQTAFFVAPGTNNVTITGLTLRDLARPIVIIDANNTTIGSPGGVPNANANRIVGNASMNSGILAVARGGAVTVNGTVFSDATPPAMLANLTVAGNYISYNPPGGADGRSAYMAAIDVHQLNWFGPGEAENITISSNAVGFFHQEAPFPTENGIRVQGHEQDNLYHVRNVTISGNNLGRLEEADSVVDLNAGDVHHAGRIGVFMERVDGFTISGNGVRARISQSAVALSGGGIVVGDSSNGVIQSNSSIVLADSGTLDEDLGAIGIIDDLSSLQSGSLAGGPPADSVTVKDNIIGGQKNELGGQTPALAQRGIVLNGATNATVTGNDVRVSTADAIAIAVKAMGTNFDAETPTPVTLQNAVSKSVICNNKLDGTLDKISEIEYGGAGSTLNAFPGSSFPNLKCTPTISLSGGPIRPAGGSLTASGKAWSGRPVQVNVAGGSTLSQTITAAADGTYSATFLAADLATLADGLVHAISFASAPGTSLTRSSQVVATFKGAGPAAPTITGPAGLQPAKVVVSGTGEPFSTLKLFQGTTLLGSAGVNRLGNWSKTLILLNGINTLTATVTDAHGVVSPASALFNVSVDAVNPTVVIDSPIEGSILIPGGTNVVSGTATDNGQVVRIELRYYDFFGRLVLVADATCTGCPGPSVSWQNSPGLGPGPHTVVAAAYDSVNNFTVSAPRGFVYTV